MGGSQPITYHQNHSKPVIPLNTPFLWFWLYSPKPANTIFPQPYKYLSLKKIHLANIWFCAVFFFSVLGLQTSKTMWISNATGSFWLQFSYLEERKQSRRHLAVCNNKTENWQKAQCLDCETCLPEENSGAIQSIFCPKQMLKTQGNTTDQKKKLTTEKPEWVQSYLFRM